MGETAKDRVLSRTSLSPRGSQSCLHLDLGLLATVTRWQCPALPALAHGQCPAAVEVNPEGPAGMVPMESGPWLHQAQELGHGAHLGLCTVPDSNPGTY